MMILSGSLFLFGWVLFGGTSIWANKYPRWLSFLLGFGLMLGLPLRLPFPGGRSLGFGLWGIGFIFCGELKIHQPWA